MFVGITVYSQNDSSFIFPDSTGWNVIEENETLAFQVRSVHGDSALFSLEYPEELNIQFDSLGNFSWMPSFDLVDRISKTKDIRITFQQELKNGKREKHAINFTVHHVNRP